MEISIFCETASPREESERRPARAFAQEVRNHLVDRMRKIFTPELAHRLLDSAQLRFKIGKLTMLVELHLRFMHCPVLDLEATRRQTKIAT